MTRHSSSSKRNIMSIAGALVLATAAVLPQASPFSLTSVARAWVGQPWTPGSVAGATRRAAVYRSTIFVNSLPPSCNRVTVRDTALWFCGGTYYQRYGNRYVVVYVH
jgi:hypothetical protein